MIENRGNAPWDVYLTVDFVALHGPYCVYAAWEKWMKEQEGDILEGVEDFDSKAMLYVAMEKACDYAANVAVAKAIAVKVTDACVARRGESELAKAIKQQNDNVN